MTDVTVKTVAERGGSFRSDVKRKEVEDISKEVSSRTRVREASRPSLRTANRGPRGTASEDLARWRRARPDGLSEASTRARSVQQASISIRRRRRCMKIDAGRVALPFFWRDEWSGLRCTAAHSG